MPSIPQFVYLPWTDRAVKVAIAGAVIFYLAFVGWITWSFAPGKPLWAILTLPLAPLVWWVPVVVWLRCWIARWREERRRAYLEGISVEARILERPLPNHGYNPLRVSFAIAGADNQGTVNVPLDPWARCKVGDMLPIRVHPENLSICVLAEEPSKLLLQRRRP